VDPIDAAVITGIVSAIPPTLTALAALLVALKTQSKVSEVVKSSNGTQTKLIESTAKASFLEGEKSGLSKH
jgi:hypothetical protein